MTFDEVLEQIRELLQSKGRVAYRALKRRFDLDDEYLEDLKAELIDAEHVACDEDGKVLVWTGVSPVSGSTFQVSSSQPTTPSPQTLDSRLDAAERRQLTVQFIDLVGSTALSTQLDPEELRQVIRAYRETCANIIGRFDGHLAKYIGDGLLVYFGYPLAHEDDAQRAVRTALGIVEAIQKLSFPTIQLPRPLQIRIGIHTGLVVAGEMGVGDQPEPLAIVGETPNLAARLQEKAAPNTVLISAATYRLVAGYFTCRDLGLVDVKGMPDPVQVYHVVGESGVHSRLEVAATKGLTPLVGREEELALLRRHWARAKEGDGQVVLLSGEPGIGKSRLVQEFKEQLEHEGVTRIEFRCSPYHQNSALYPIIDHLQRLLQFARDDSPTTKLEKLQHTLSHYHFPQTDTVPLLASLLSLPHPEGAPPITLSPQRQKQKTQEALVAWIVEETEKAAVYCAWEDLHWADPSTLEVLTLFLDQVPTARLLALLTFRPEFISPWGNRSHLSQMTLSRLGRSQVETMVERVTGGKALPPEVAQQIVSKTDGVPLFVEELTKTVLESGLLWEEEDRYVGAHGRAPIPPLAIPTTLQDSLMARLDRLAPVKEIAQLGATLGREFSYELIHAVSRMDEGTLQHGLRQLVEAELLYQRGQAPQATYLFKHALIQDAAYQSLLRSTRRQYHTQIARALEEQFPETKETQPELLAHHYTEAGLIEQAISYWQQAGQRAIQRSANAEAISNLTKGLELLKALPDAPERTQQELALQIAMGGPLIAIKGYTTPEVEKTYTRALELCRQVGETPQLFPVLWGLRLFYVARAELHTAHKLGEQLLSLAQRMHDSTLLLEAHRALGDTLFYLGELAPAQAHLEQGANLYDSQQHHSHAFLYGQDPEVVCLSYAALALWLLGYPDQALGRIHEALTMAHELSHPFSQASALNFAALLHQYRREGQLAREQAEAVITLSTEQGFLFRMAWGTLLRGWALAEQGQREKGIAQLRQGLAAWQATGTELARPHCLALLAEACGKVGQIEEGLSVLTEALAAVDKTGERWCEAELYRVKGELTLQQFNVQGSKFKVEERSESGVRSPESKEESLASSVQSLESEAEECFQRAIEIARQQQAKSLELRAVMSLARLWQQQGKQHAARNMLSEIYGWFTEGFDTKDLQEAKALLDSLGSSV